MRIDEGKTNEFVNFKIKVKILGKLFHLFAGFQNHGLSLDDEKLIDFYDSIEKEKKMIHTKHW